MRSDVIAMPPAPWRLTVAFGPERTAFAAKRSAFLHLLLRTQIRLSYGGAQISDTTTLRNFRLVYDELGFTCHCTCSM
jgi:hypothetical protein